MSEVVAAGDLPRAVVDKSGMSHGTLSESQDALADLAVDEFLPKATDTTTAASDIDTAQDTAVTVAERSIQRVQGVEGSPDSGAAVEVTPEDAAAAECAEEFVGLYEYVSLHNHLNRPTWSISLVIIEL